jgi:hypothetical protein
VQIILLYFYFLCFPSASHAHVSRSMAQAVSRRPFIAEALVRAPVSPCEICGGQSDTGTGFCPSSSVFCNIIAEWLPILTYYLGDEQWQQFRDIVSHHRHEQHEHHSHVSETFQ